MIAILRRSIFGALLCLYLRLAYLLWPQKTRADRAKLGEKEDNGAGSSPDWDIPHILKALSGQVDLKPIAYDAVDRRVKTGRGGAR